MPQSLDVNRQIILARRPVGAPDDESLQMKLVDVPEPGPGEMLLRTVYLSLDPYMRGRMSDARSYAEPIAIGDPIVGGTVSRVVRSNIEGFKPGDWVLSYNGWQDYAVSDGAGVVNLGRNPENPSWTLGVLGMPGYTAYCGLLYIGEPKPGETVVTAAATGPVGSTVGQLAKIKGCRAVGIAGGPEKCAHAVEVLGFDACIDRNAPDFRARLKEACPDGIDVYFENVGGEVLAAVLPLLNPKARIPLCGLVSQYNATGLPEGPDLSGWMLGTFLVKRVKLQGFIINLDFPDKFPEFMRDVGGWVREGKIRYREQIVEGLENAPEAFRGLLEGRNFGKLVIKVGPEEIEAG